MGRAGYGPGGARGKVGSGPGSNGQPCPNAEFGCSPRRLGGLRSVLAAPPTRRRPRNVPHCPPTAHPRCAPGSPVSGSALSSDHLVNRELSMLAFNRRVLAQALDPNVPLLERLRFLTITSTNLDEFFEIRVSRLQQQRAYGLDAPRLDGRTPQDALDLIAAEAHDLVAEQYRVLQGVLLPELDRAGIRILRPDTWSPAQQDWVQRHFRNEVLPVLTPIGLDPAHPFPHVQNKNLALIVTLDGQDAFGRRSGIAVVQVPRALPRVMRVPDPGEPRGQRSFVMLSRIIQTHVAELFPGMTVTACVPFRITRDADLWVAEEETDDLLEALQSELHKRNQGDAVRLEVAEACTAEMAHYLLQQFELQDADLYAVQGPVNVHRLAAICDLADRPDLRWPVHVPRTPRGLMPNSDVFAAIKRSDVLLHHPYDAPGPVLELLKQAATDTQVLAIKMTLYRTGHQSPFAQALATAARAGKDVTAVVELRARFDEAANIDLATWLQEAGANVVYGVVGLKTHAKLLLVVRREAGGIRRYAHLATGNYHPTTARAYTDLGLLTSDPEVTEDVHQVFLQLTGLGTVRGLRTLWLAPFQLQSEVIARIDREADKARRGEASRVIAKMNALAEPQVIEALYRASQAGVPIDLIVRGICCLRPGVLGLSETIRVRSIVGRFLEHARVFSFGVGPQREVWASSADWMERNFSRRVEVAFPIRDPLLAERAVQECLSGALRDNLQVWALDADGEWTRVQPDEGEVGFSLQDALLKGGLG
ncbi:MAG: polyphosphate kinase 1 [Myxococcales bacterium]|nr:polyphosphate kinase 1 [Myxococcales bacterium]